MVKRWYSNPIAMINDSLLNPRSIVVVGASNDVEKPGGKLLKNLLDGSYAGALHVVNQKESHVQGIRCLPTVEELEAVDLAILSVPAKYCPQIVHVLASRKETRAFIILSAGFAELDEQGKQWEEEITRTVNAVNGCLLGPNCIGVLNKNYHGVFTTPIPPLDTRGCDLISSSGATAVFLLEAGMSMGLRFSSVFSVGNSAQTSVEDILEYMDLNHDPETDAPVKLLYLESVAKPQKLLKHAASLIRKGVRIAAIKAGTSAAGSRAAASHTGALTNPGLFVQALFKKAGIIQCHGRQALLNVAGVLGYRQLEGKNIAVITHAGGPAVMLTDALSAGGLEIPALEGQKTQALLKQLHPGSSASNPIDFLATGSAEQLGLIIDFCEHELEQVDAMVVIFGSPGLFDVSAVYQLLRDKLESCRKPVYPVLPSVINARDGIEQFLAAGYTGFTDEVVLARALSAVYNTPGPGVAGEPAAIVDNDRIRRVIDAADDGFLPPAAVTELLDACGISRPTQYIVNKLEAVRQSEHKVSFPLAMKVIGPIHKTDIGGVVLDVQSTAQAEDHFARLMRIEGAEAVLLQSMVSGMELFVGVKREPGFGHLVVCGMGGVFIEALNDFRACLAPVSACEADEMIQGLDAYPVIRGSRGQQGADEAKFADIIGRVSALVMIAPEIAELDINPLMATEHTMTAVDTRIRIEK